MYSVLFVDIYVESSNMNNKILFWCVNRKFSCHFYMYFNWVGSNYYQISFVKLIHLFMYTKILIYLFIFLYWLIVCKSFILSWLLNKFLGLRTKHINKNRKGLNTKNAHGKHVVFCLCFCVSHFHLSTLLHTSPFSVFFTKTSKWKKVHWPDGWINPITSSVTSTALQNTYIHLHMCADWNIDSDS